MARHKAELPSQPMERAIDIPGGPAGRQVQHAKRAQRQYRQRGGEEELEGDAGFNALPNQAAGMAAATRMQEMEHEARARAKRARGVFSGASPDVTLIPSFQMSVSAWRYVCKQQHGMLLALSAAIWPAEFVGAQVLNLPQVQLPVLAHHTVHPVVQCGKLMARAMLSSKPSIDPSDMSGDN